MGASGVVGRELLRAATNLPKSAAQLTLRAALRPPKFAVRESVAHRSPEQESARERPREVEFVPFELSDPATLQRAFEGVDALFSMTPLIDEQVPLSLRVLDFALDAGVRQVVRLSSRSARWDMESELRAWHREIDADIAARAPLYTILRPCSFMQNFLTHQAAGIRGRGVVALPLGAARLPYIDARDIADVALAALIDPARHHAQTYELTGPQALDMTRVAQALGDARGAPLRYVDVDPSVAEDGMRRSSMPAWLVDSALRVHARTRAGLEAELSPAVERVLGRPARSVEAYARDHAHLLQPRGAE